MKQILVLILVFSLANLIYGFDTPKKCFKEFKISLKEKKVKSFVNCWSKTDKDSLFKQLNSFNKKNKVSNKEFFRLGKNEYSGILKSKIIKEKIEDKFGYLLVKIKEFDKEKYVWFKFKKEKNSFKLVGVDFVRTLNEEIERSIK